MCDRAGEKVGEIKNDFRSKKNSDVNNDVYNNDINNNDIADDNKDNINE